MFKYAVQRFLYMLLVLLIITCMCFILVRMLPPETLPPGDPRAHVIELRRQAQGYNEPYLVQFGIFLKDVFTEFDWGVSDKLFLGRDVLEIFSEKLPASPLHWLIADKDESIVLECTEEGMKIYDNPFGVLTNNPTFDFHLTNINNYMSLHEGSATNRMDPDSSLSNYSLGMGAMGLPGDFSSASRFVKAVFVKEKSRCDDNEKSAVNQFFHILQSVAMPRGCVRIPSGEYEYTRYSCCCTDEGVYYCTTYKRPEIQRVDMNSSDLEGSKLVRCPMV